jgi:hypothetical protein
MLKYFGITNPQVPFSLTETVIAAAGMKGEPEKVDRIEEFIRCGVLTTPDDSLAFRTQLKKATGGCAFRIYENTNLYRRSPT